MLNFIKVQKFIKYKIDRKKLTILKSPHVNKIAQEQFETKIYIRKIEIQAYNLSSFLIFIKKTINYLFPSIKINLNLDVSRNYKFKIYSFYNYKIYFYKRTLENIFSNKKKLFKNTLYESKLKINSKKLRNSFKLFDI